MRTYLKPILEYVHCYSIQVRCISHLRQRLCAQQRQALVAAAHEDRAAGAQVGAKQAAEEQKEVAEAQALVFHGAGPGALSQREQERASPRANKRIYVFFVELLEGLPVASASERQCWAT